MLLLLQRVSANGFLRTFTDRWLLHSHHVTHLLPALHFHRQNSTFSPSNKPWLPIYQLPIARLAAAFNGLKVYQALVTAVGTPVTFALEQADVLSAGTSYVFAALGISGMLTLTLCSLGAQNLVGIIYMNQVEDRIKLAYVDFWGRRKETEIEIEDLIPEWEQQRPSRFNFYQLLRLYSDPKRKYKLLHNYGVVLDPKKFVQLFGE